jgi:rhomboid protease GluP
MRYNKLQVKPTIMLMILVAIGYIVGYILSLFDITTFIYLIQVNFLVFNGDYISLLTSIFITNSFIDFFFNFMSLGVIYYLFRSYAGKVEYLVFLMSGIVGNILTLFAFPPRTASEGASGGIFGIFAYYVILDMLELNKIDYNGLGLLIFVFILSDIIPNVNYVAHIGGIITGVILALVTFRLLRKNKRI